MGKKQRKRVYVAGPYTCEGRCKPLGIDLVHMRRGIQTSAELLANGYAPFCPWLDFLFHFAAHEDQIPTKDDYYEYSLAWLEVSDAMLVIGQRDPSVGVKEEIELAMKCWIPIYYNLDDLMRDM